MHVVLSYYLRAGHLVFDCCRFIGEGTHMTIDPTTALEFFQQPRKLSGDHNTGAWDGYRDDMCCGIQGGYTAYVSGDKEPQCERGRVRWGYAWNNEGDCGSP